MCSNCSNWIYVLSQSYNVSLSLTCHATSALRTKLLVKFSSCWLRCIASCRFQYDCDAAHIRWLIIWDPQMCHLPFLFVYMTVFAYFCLHGYHCFSTCQITLKSKRCVGVGWIFLMVGLLNTFAVGAKAFKTWHCVKVLVANPRRKFPNGVKVSHKNSGRNND